MVNDSEERHFEPAPKPLLFRNPLTRGVYRNKSCICGAKEKVKNCHGQTYAITENELKEINDLIKGVTNGNGKE